jgi:hypothetical protein
MEEVKANASKVNLLAIDVSAIGVFRVDIPPIHFPTINPALRRRRSRTARGWV